MSNFDFLQSEWPKLFNKMQKAEERVNTEPVSTASYCRLVLEECIHLLYDIEYIELPFNKDLVNLMVQEEVKDIIPYQHLDGLHIVRKTGNNAAHYGRRVGNTEALTSLRYLYDFLKWFAGNYSDVAPELPGVFNVMLIPQSGTSQRQIKDLQKESEKEQQKLQAQIAQLIKYKETAEAKAQQSEASLEAFKQQQEQAKKELQQQKQDRKIPVSLEFNEAETRQHLIDINLQEAGWFQLNKGKEIEFPVVGMPITPNNPKSNGFVDYVLWGDNGKPLALIEAKRTSKDLEVGRRQAFLYADCLEQMYKQRPIIFYTNGFEIKIWDDTFYNTPRRIYGFYTKDELQRLIQRRTERKDIRKATVNQDIAGRYYQIEAIKRVSEFFVTDSAGKLKGDKRRALLVMATGSGKTRTAAALVDVFLKYNWVKRVLFLADRNALVRQAKRNFSEYLPDISSINLTEEKENDTTRLVFSTYPTMMNQIDNNKSDNERFYGVGHFDLIIIDEAHRSIYNRYKAIFEYFDALIVGLTATPKDSIDHNTFEIFGCSNDDPTFFFELDEAVPTYLKPYKNMDVSTEFLREGIKYSQLSEKEKIKYEETFADKTTGLFPDEIAAYALNKWLFNKDTVNKVLDTLMTEGLTIEGGDKIGRTIIFAVNQKHAQFIVDCFTDRYPDKPANFIATIHNQVSHAQSLIDAFCDEFKENDPQIVVSVDMMDTGIDAPRVLNLVFFKVVRSYAKFWQMIGRGTRLCSDVFGIDQPKEYFLIFDVCQNFEFFEVNTKGKEARSDKTLSQQIFESRLQLSKLLQETGEEENLKLASNLLDILHSAIHKLDKKRFQVNMKLKYVEIFKDRERWNNLDSEDIHLIETHLSNLPPPDSKNETARRFDLMMLKLQISNLLSKVSERGFYEKLMTIAEQLSKKYTIPQVLQAKPLIEPMKDPDFYQQLSQKKLEQIREEIRELVQYLEKAGKEPIYSDIKDSEVTITEAAPLETYNNKIYKKRVERFIRENKHQLTISKLSTNQQITPDELLKLEEILFDGSERGTKEDFVKEYGKKPLGMFIRSILGLEEAAAKEAFAEFLQVGNLRADQMTFINNIITYLTKNGIIENKILFEPPFTDVNDQGLLGVFDASTAGKIISILDRINDNAGVA